MNAYEMMTEVKDHLDEVDQEHWDDVDILRKINRSHRRAANMILLEDKRWLLKKSSALTPSNSSITLPTDCLKPVYLETEDGYPIPFDSSVENRSVTRVPASTIYTGSADAYTLESTIVLNSVNFTDTCYVWYIRRVNDLIAGTGAEGSSSTTLVVPAAMRPKKTDDYYNDDTIELVTGTGAPESLTVSDYDGGTRTITLSSGSCDDTTTFGTVSQLPEELVDFVILQASVICLAKPSATFAAEYFAFLANELRESRNELKQFFASRIAGDDYVEITGD